MLKAIFQNTKTIKEKIDELKKITSQLEFLDTLRDPSAFLEEFIPFADQVFTEIPLDSSMTFGPDNEMRVFFIRLLSKFNYKGIKNDLLLEMIYKLLATENIFNRYLTLKILFSLLDSDITIDHKTHLKCINTFFKDELPSTEGFEHSRCKLGLFSASEALNYLKHYQIKNNLPTIAYEEILYSLTGALKFYFVQRTIEDFYHNKKISCEFCSFGINLFKFINNLSIPTSHYLIPFIPEMCFTLCNMCPRDCILLQCDVMNIVTNTLSARKDILFNLDKYFLKNPFLIADSPFLKIKNLKFLSELMKEFGRNMTKIVFLEFDSRICDYIPLHKDLPVLFACIDALTVNLSFALKYPMDPSELKLLAFKHIKNANKIYKRLHLPKQCQHQVTSCNTKNVCDNKGVCDNHLHCISNTSLNTDASSQYSTDHLTNNLTNYATNSYASQHPSLSITEEMVDLKFLSYLKVFIKTLTTVQMPKSLDWEDILILGQLLLFPLTRDISSSDYLALFNDFPVETLESIILPIINEIFTHFHSQIFSWNVLMKSHDIFSHFIKSANVAIHNDFVSGRFNSFDYYQRIFPISYGFFKIDKRFIKPECSDLFSFNFDCLINFTNLISNSLPFSNKMAIELINSMFLDIKSCEIAYNGLYFIYDTFGNTVKELYTMYTLSFDTFYLECLFNIPVSLNLLVTKYSILIPPMAAGLKSSKKLREIVMKYVEYIIEFDTDDGINSGNSYNYNAASSSNSGMNNLLILIFDLLQEHSLKGINVFSRISNKHRDILNSGELKGYRLMKETGLSIRREVKKSNQIENDSLFMEDHTFDINQISETVINSLKNEEMRNERNVEHSNFNIPIDNLKRLSIPALIGYEFSYENSIRKLPYLGSCSRILKGVENLKESSDTARDILIDYLLRLLKLNEIPSNSYSGILKDNLASENVKNSTLKQDEIKYNRIRLLKNTRILQSISDISFSLLLDDNKKSLEILQCICSEIDFDFLCEIVPDGLVYSFERTMEFLDFIFAKRAKDLAMPSFIYKTICTLIDFIYSSDDLKSNRAFHSLSAFLSKAPYFIPSSHMRVDNCNSLPCHSKISHVGANLPSYWNNSMVRDAFHCIFYKMKRCDSFRIYKIAIDISFTILKRFSPDSISIFEKSIDRSIRNDFPYLRALIFELQSTFCTSNSSESLPEMDKLCSLRIFRYSKLIILRIENLSNICESFLKSLNKRDLVSIDIFVNLLSKIRKNESLFADILIPVKKYLPPIAVLEGFQSLEARKKFVENVNRNGNFQIQNPNSLKVFRNLFYDCKINNSIKSSVIDFYNTPGFEHKTTLLEILLNCLEYDLASFDFLITKLSEMPSLNISHINGLSKETRLIYKTLWSRIELQSNAIKESLLLYLIERIHISFIYNFIDFCVPNTIEITNILTGILNDFLNNNHTYREQQGMSKSAYNILRYLKKRNCKFNDNKAVLIAYRDLYLIESEIDDLVNWYFKNFSPEDIEVLFRVNCCFLITSECLISKLVIVESTSTRNWMLSCLKKQLGCARNGCENLPSFIDQKYQEIINLNNEVQESDLNHNQLVESLENTRLTDCSGFLYRCIACYLKSKGKEINENLIKRTFEILSAYEDHSFSCENDSDDLKSLNITGYTSESDISLFIDNDKSQGESEDLFENQVRIDEYLKVNEKSNSKIISQDEIDNKSKNQSNSGSNSEITSEESTGSSMESNESAADTASTEVNNEAVEKSKSDCYDVTLKDLSIILPLFYESINVIVELFCDLRIYSKDLVKFCATTPHASYRFASLFYLSMFEPQLSHFEDIFKLNYQESKYVINCLKLLVAKFGTKPFYEVVKTVLRSEMRFKATESILVPFLLSDRRFFHDNEIVFEVCVFSKRLLNKGTINYTLMNLINSFENISKAFKEDLNTQLILIELLNGKAALYETDNYNRKAIQNTKSPRVFELFERDCKNASKNGQIACDIENINGKFDREMLRSIFNENLLTNLSKTIILYLDLPYQTYVNSTLENQLTILEILIDHSPNMMNSTNEVLVIALLNNLVSLKYPNLARFNSIYSKLIKICPFVINWLTTLLVDNEFVYPPLFEYLPEVFEHCSPEIAVSLCSKRPVNISIDTVEMNIFHLFKILPFSLDSMKLEFFNGFLSKNKITRKCYLDLLVSHIPSDVFSVIQYIFLFNYSNLDDIHVEYFIMAVLYKSLITSNEIYSGENTNLINDEDCINFNSFGKAIHKFDLPFEIYQHLNVFVPSISDILIPMKDLSICTTWNYPAVVESLLQGVFSSLSNENIKYLNRIFNENFNRCFRIKLPFYKAFINANINVYDFIFNPFTPSLKFYQLADRDLYVGLMKSKGGLREVKGIIKLVEENNENEALARTFDFFKKVSQRQVSYNMEDIDFLENEVKRIYLNNGISIRNNNIVNPPYSQISDNLKCFSSALQNYSEIELIEMKFLKVLDSLENDRNILEDIRNIVNSLAIMFYLPRNNLLLSKLLMFASITSEIIESSIIFKDNLTDSIFGRFRMWMIRHPSFLSSFIDWNIFMKWRSFIFYKALALVAENDKKKISTEICKLNCIYSSKAFKEKLYLRSCAILNEVSAITTVEINQNMQRILLDLENLYHLKEYNTMVSLINSLNITKFSNEEKSRLYYWIYKALKKLGKNSDSEKYGTLSRKLCEIIENKRDDLEIIKERLKFRTAHERNLIEENFSASGFFSLFPSMSNSELENSYVSKLLEVINELNIEDSRPYVMELLKCSYPVQLESISHRKLYFFLPQIKNNEFILAKNSLLRSSIESIDIFTSLYSHSNDNNTNVSLSTDGNGAKKIKLMDLDTFVGLDALMDSKAPEISKIKNISENLIIQQVQSSLANVAGCSLFSFEKDTALPGEFSILRNKYDDIRTMEYIEGTNDVLKGIFFVRNTDGSLCKVVAHENESSSQSQGYFQFIQFFYDVLKNYNFECLGTRCIAIPTFVSSSSSGVSNTVFKKFTNLSNTFTDISSAIPVSNKICNDNEINSISFSVHKVFDTSADILLKLQFFKRGDPLHSLYTKFLNEKIQFSPLVALCNSISEFKYLIKNEILDTVVDYNDFYVYKRNFINSYSPLLFFQYLLGLNNISMENTYLDRSGNAYLSNINSIKEKTYFRPNFQMIFGSEGINGPLYNTFSEFLAVSSTDLAVDSFVFFGMGTASDIKKKTATSNIQSKEDDFVNIVISDLIDPKTGLSLPVSRYPWL